MNRVFMEDMISTGDLNNDGEEDAVSILVGSTGGTGSFYYLAASLNQNGHMVPVDTTFLGDRVIIDSLEILNGKIHIVYFTHAPDQPMAEQPKQRVEKTFILENNKLIAITP